MTIPAAERLLLCCFLLITTSKAIDTVVSLDMRNRFWSSVYSSGNTNLTAPVEGTFNQTLDHFNVLTGGFWQQRFVPLALG